MELLINKDTPRILIANQKAEFKDFYEFANQMESKLLIAFSEKIHDFDSLYYKFDFMNIELILDYNIYTGISISPVNTKIDPMLLGKVFNELFNLIKAKLTKD